jgi:hypothetical protein
LGIYDAEGEAGVRPVRLQPENPGPDCLVALGHAIDLVATALEIQDPEDEIWPSTSERAWEKAVQALQSALRLADEERARHERRAVQRAVQLGHKCCAICLAWRPESELNVVAYGSESNAKGNTPRRYYRCFTHREGKNADQRHGDRHEGGAPGDTDVRRLLADSA